MGSAGITGLGNEAVTLTDTTLAAATLNTLDGQTSGVINAASVTAGQVQQQHCPAYASGGITGPVMNRNIV